MVMISAVKKVWVIYIVGPESEAIDQSKRDLANDFRNKDMGECQFFSWKQDRG